MCLVVEKLIKECFIYWYTKFFKYNEWNEDLGYVQHSISSFLKIGKEKTDFAGFHIYENVCKNKWVIN